jgi:ATP-binding cassette, subfamily A (ABC1), member 3
MGLLLRQIGALVRKDLLIMFNRRGARISTIWRAWIIPVVFALYMGILLKVYWPKEEYGIGKPSQVLSLPDAMLAAKGGRNTLALVNSVSPEGDIDRVIELISREVPEGKTVKTFDNHFDLIETCRSSLQGTTKCFGAVVFNSSPNEGNGGIWNYTLRGDASFGTNVDVRKTTNDPQIYQLPLQRAVDTAIAKVNSSGDAVTLPSIVDGYRKL